MDGAFACFLEEFGPCFDSVDVADSTLIFYKGKLPDQLLKYWTYIWLVQLCQRAILDRQSQHL